MLNLFTKGPYQQDTIFFISKIKSKIAACVFFFTFSIYIILYFFIKVNGAPPRIRTETVTGLSRFPLPVGVEEHIIALEYLLLLAQRRH